MNVVVLMKKENKMSHGTMVETHGEHKLNHTTRTTA